MKTYPNRVFARDRSVAVPATTPVQQYSIREGLVVVPKTLLRGAGALTAGANDAPAPYSNKKKLSTADEVTIRNRYAKGEIQRVLAKEYGVSQGVISRVTKGITRPL